MKLSQFRFDLPLNLIAQNPTKRREDSRMMVIHRKTGELENKHFKDILDYFDDKDAFVVNNTKVFPARMYGRKEKTGARIEVFLLRELNKPNRLWDVIVDPARKIRVGNKLYFGENDELVAEVIDNTTSRGRTIRFLWDGTEEEFRVMLDFMGETPLPKYIKRKPDEEDKERYQTVYAAETGSAAAPTAGLHFTPEILSGLRAHGVEIADVILHVGAGTFKPVEVDDPAQHVMHEEWYEVPALAAQQIATARSRGARTWAVGTTSVRTLESAASADGTVASGSNETSIFIRPPYTFRAVDHLLTNFHLPHSTLIMLVAAFAGFDLTMRAYATAVEERYRFFSYGDAMLIL